MEHGFAGKGGKRKHAMEIKMDSLMNIDGGWVDWDAPRGIGVGDGRFFFIARLKHFEKLWEEELKW